MTYNNIKREIIKYYNLNGNSKFTININDFTFKIGSLGISVMWPPETKREYIIDTILNEKPTKFGG